MTTKQDLPNYRSQRLLTHQIVSLQQETNKNLFAKADSLVDKTLTYPRIMLGNSQS